MYVAPTEKILKIKKTKQRSNYLKKDGKLDIAVDEIGHYLKLLSNSIGDRLEWMYNPLLMYALPELGDLQDLVNNTALSKSLLNPYLFSARHQWLSMLETKEFKKGLYALRTYMAGITIFEKHQVISDINELNKNFNIPIVNEMVEFKREAIDFYKGKELHSLVQELDKRLIESSKTSSLSDKPDIDQINEFLVRTRLDNK